jgi:general secretion pathway protein F
LPTFAYRALTAGGERVAGEVEAADARTAIVRLQETGLIPIDAAPVRARASAAVPRTRGGRSAKAVTQLTRELATLIGAGQTLEGALALVGEELSQKDLAATLGRVLVKVRSGVSLSEALAQEPQYFPALYVSMVRAGEAAGRLDKSLRELAELRERTEQLQAKLTSALIYPCILTLTAVGSVMLLLTLVVPQLEPMFASAGAALPTSTRAVLAVSGFVREQGTAALAVLLVLLVAARFALRLPGPRRAFDGTLLRLPVLGALMRERLTAQLTRGLATLLGGGLDLPQALVVARGMLSNTEAQARLEQATTRVRTGRTLAESLGEARIIAPVAAKMLRVGEESGRLQTVAAHLATAYEEKVSLRLQRLVAVIEPAMVIVLGLVVGGIVTSILTAVISVNELAF